MFNLKDLTKNIIASHETRTQIIQEITEDTQKLIENFKKQREEMSKELKEALAKSQSLQKDFNKMMEEVLMVRSKREEEVEKMLAGFRKEQTEIVEKLRDLLSRGEHIKLADFKRTLADIKKGQVKIDTRNIGGEIRIELTQMREGIYGMLKDFSAKSGSFSEGKRNKFHD